MYHTKLVKDFKRIVTIWLEVVNIWILAGGAKCKGKTLLVIEMSFTLSRYFTVTVQYWCSVPKQKTTGLWLDLEGCKYGPLDLKSCFNLVQWFIKIQVPELVVGFGEPDKCLEEKKIAKVFILSLMSTHDFWNVHIHTQQSKLLQNKQWKKENIYQLRQSKFDHKFKNPKISGNFSFFVGNFYVHNSNAILISPKNFMVQNSALKIIWSLSFLKLIFLIFYWK